MTIFLPSAPGPALGTRVRTLSLPDGRSLDLTDTEGFYISSLDVGFPAAKDSTAPLPYQDGTLDFTAYYGPRTISIQGMAVETNGRSPAANLAALAPFLTPGTKVTLTVATDNDIEPVSIQMRATQFSGPLTAPDYVTFQVQWIAPDPIFYALDPPNEVDIEAISEPVGIALPLTLPFSFPVASGGTGWSFVNVGGNYPTWPTFHAFGLIQNPTIQLADASGNIMAEVPFTGLVVNEGDFLSIDTKNRTVYLNGDTGASRYSSLDFPNLNWFQLQPGQNLVRYAGSGFATVDSMLAVYWNNAFLLPGVQL